jgi:hypothetical protein
MTLDTILAPLPESSVILHALESLGNSAFFPQAEPLLSRPLCAALMLVGAWRLLAPPVESDPGRPRV